MWLKSIELKNIKGFSHQTISFENRNKPYKWITLLGENGVGKSTLMQAIALLLAGPDAAKKLMSLPQSWVRNDSQYGQLTANIQKNNDDEGMMQNRGRNKFSYDYSYFFIGDKNTRIGKDNYPANTLNAKNSETIEWLRTNAFTLDSQGWFAAGYGPFRRLSRTERYPVRLGELKRKNRETNFNTQFNENDSLSTFEEWMVFLDYRIAKNPDDSQSKEMRRLGEDAILELLPGNIKIDQVSNDGIIIFSLENQLIPITQLSDGFRSIIALAGDLIWRLLQTFSHLEDKDPREASGIVLIDELDIHLHPVWQRLIAKKLRTVFPNIQFFVATHSPFITAGAGDDALTLKLKMINGEVQIEEVKNIAAYDFDYILRSPAFGLVSTHSPDVQDKIDRYDYLTGQRNNLTVEEIQEYEELRQFMKEFKPIGGKPEPGSLDDKINRFLEENLK
ncbi:MAG: AAA family ATPase [Sphaerospermopsis kisseleviana]|uniref:AAA family ATPase n=1 Tax=Sphaerospermopsis sp. FACHB-1194 TaxID=2692862 RepID=UPI0016809E86|nr:AAA family ATPase [Sphaerospermopsis sp. FACHB-1194]MBD2144042.1 AAA family ATPase [Sphaerospermopsis sp. FACHB-1194]